MCAFESQRQLVQDIVHVTSLTFELTFQKNLKLLIPVHTGNSFYSAYAFYDTKHRCIAGEFELKFKSHQERSLQAVGTWQPGWESQGAFDINVCRMSYSLSGN
jgi:hypothetical protein